MRTLSSPLFGVVTSCLCSRTFAKVQLIFDTRTLLAFWLIISSSLHAAQNATVNSSKTWSQFSGETSPWLSQGDARTRLCYTSRALVCCRGAVAQPGVELAREPRGDRLHCAVALRLLLNLTRSHVSDPPSPPPHGASSHRPRISPSPFHTLDLTDAKYSGQLYLVSKSGANSFVTNSRTEENRIDRNDENEVERDE